MSRRPRGLRAGRFQIGCEKFVVVSYAIPKAPTSAALTVAERDVLGRILAGESNQQIANARRTTVRTVAKQVGSVMTKLGAGSRAELWTLIAR
jgi:DNA-binding NarL/FixJ family response regulator